MSKLLKDYNYTKFEYNEIQEHIDAALTDCSWAKDDYNKNLRAIGDMFFQWEITPELRFKTAAGINMRDLHGRYFTALNPEHGEALSVNTLTEQHFRQDEWSVTNTLNYRNVIFKYYFFLIR